MRITRAALSVSQPVTPRASAHWRAHGLVALFDQRTCVEVIHGVRGVNTATQVQAFHGQAMDYSGTANTQYEHRPAYAQTGPVTIIALVEVDALTNYTAIIAKQATTTTHAPYEWRLGSSALATDSKQFFLRADAGSFQYVDGTAATIAAGYSGVLALTCESGALSATNTTAYWREGSAVLGTKSGAGTATTDNAATVWIGRRYDGATQLDGRIYYVALFDRALSQDEILEIIGNPWALYEGPPRVLPFGTTGGPSTIDPATLTFTASSLAGSSTASSAITATTLTFTASTLTGSSTASSAITSAALTFTGETLVGSNASASTMTAAAMTFTASSLAGSSTASSAITSSALTFAAQSLAGASTASSAITATTLTFTGETLVGSAGGSVISAAALTFTASSLAGASTVVSTIGPASLTFTAQTMVGSGGNESIGRRRRTRTYKTKIPEDPLPIISDEPHIAVAPDTKSGPSSLIPDAQTLIVEQFGKARRLKNVAEVKRRAAIEEADERAIERALLDYF